MIHTEETKRKISESLKGKKSFMFGKHHSEEARKKISAAAKNRTEEHKRKFSKAFKGKHHSEETKLKMSKDRKNKPKPEEYRRKRIGDKNPNWKGGKVKITCEICGKEKYIFSSVIRKGSGKFCSRRCLSISNTKHMKRKDTSIELAIENELIRRNIPYLKQVPIEGIALVDFLLSNRIILQADGDYWHSRNKNKGKDIAQDTVLYFKGYKVYRFTETEIKKSAKRCIDKISSQYMLDEG